MTAPTTLLIGSTAFSSITSFLLSTAGAGLFTTTVICGVGGTTSSFFGSGVGTSSLMSTLVGATLASLMVEVDYSCLIISLIISGVSLLLSSTGLVSSFGSLANSSENICLMSVAVKVGFLTSSSKAFLLSSERR